MVTGHCSSCLSKAGTSTVKVKTLMRKQKLEKAVSFIQVLYTRHQELLSAKTLKKVVRNKDAEGSGTHKKELLLPKLQQ